MAEPKLLLSDEEYAAIKIRAAKSGLKPQDLMRDAVRSMMAASEPPARPRPLGPSVSDVLQMLYSLASDAEKLTVQVKNAADELKGLIATDGSNTTDAGAAARRPGVVDELLQEVGEVNRRARGAIADATTTHRGSEGTDTGTTGPRVGPKKRR